MLVTCNMRNVYAHSRDLSLPVSQISKSWRFLKAQCAAVLPEFITSSKDRKSTRLNSSHANISYAVFCLKKKTSNQLQDFQVGPFFYCHVKRHQIQER